MRKQNETDTTVMTNAQKIAFRAAGGFSTNAKSA